MGARSGATDPDVLAGSLSGAGPTTGVSVRVWASPQGTFVEVRQHGGDNPPAGKVVNVRRFPRTSQETPDPFVMAAFLARMVSAFDREGWEGVRL